MVCDGLQFLKHLKIAGKPFVSSHRVAKPKVLQNIMSLTPLLEDTLRIFPSLLCLGVPKTLPATLDPPLYLIHAGPFISQFKDYKIRRDHMAQQYGLVSDKLMSRDIIPCNL